MALHLLFQGGGQLGITLGQEGRIEAARLAANVDHVRCGDAQGREMIARAIDRLSAHHRQGHSLRCGLGQRPIGIGSVA